jgi:hypothetical protein
MYIRTGGFHQPPPEKSDLCYYLMYILEDFLCFFHLILSSFLLTTIHHLFSPPVLTDLPCLFLSTVHHLFLPLVLADFPVSSQTTAHPLVILPKFVEYLHSTSGSQFSSDYSPPFLLSLPVLVDLPVSFRL